MIQWKSVAEDPARFERAVKLLLRRLHPAAQGMDGSGGDGGVDIWLQTDLGPVIFEVKSFTTRLTPARRREIAKSLSTAARHKPIAWRLILPLEHTPSEKAWFDGLGAQYPTILLAWQGIDWLDEQFAKHDDLRRYVEGGDYGLLARSKEMHLEQAALAQLADLGARVSTLHGRAQEISPFYRVGFTAHGDRRQITMTPATGQVSIIPKLQFDPGDPEGVQARRDLEKVLAYGGKTAIAGRFVEALHVFDADSLVEKLEPFGSGDHLHVMTPHQDAAPVPGRLRVLTRDGQAAATLDVSLTTRTAGQTGMSIHGTDLHKVVQVSLRIDRPQDGVPMSGGMDVNLSGLAGHWPAVVRPVADLLLAAEANDVIEVHVAGKPVARGHGREPLSTAVLNAARLVILLDDLQKLTGTHFPTPAEVAPAEVAMLTVLRDLHTHGKAVMPRGTISAEVNEQGRAHLLDVINANSDCKLVLDTRWEPSCAGQRFPPVEVRVNGPRVRLANRAELEAARTAGAGRVTAHFACTDDQVLEVWSKVLPSGAEG
ncbi:hypothetical protein [Nonomuraea sp. NPDC023979]|uniref:hypothetical protein n=1 Tax=Nonomuraea sp. NPDC023979 TaxID=3154796 RepID=UPI0033C64690